jgi:hypothetical protein
MICASRVQRSQIEARRTSRWLRLQLPLDPERDREASDQVFQGHSLADQLLAGKDK